MTTLFASALKPFFSVMIQCSRTTAFCLLFALFVSLLSPAWGTSSSDNPSTVEKKYKNAKSYFLQLKHEDENGGERDNWLEGIRNFRRIYLEDPTGALAPSCLYMMGRMQYDMYELFKLEEDLEDSVAYFSDVATIFPDNSLADDALFKSAEILANDKNLLQQAAVQYLKVITRYPDGDRFSLATDRLKKFNQSAKVKLPDIAVHKLQGKNPVRVLPVKYWSSKDYTRVVISASAPVRFSSDLLESNSDHPRRLYIDFNESYIPPKYRSPIPIKDGLLQQVRTGQYDENTVRVVLDMESISTYKVFSLNDPFRVVADVYGRVQGQAQQPKTIAADDKSTKVSGGIQAQQSVPNLSRNKPVKKSAVSPFITLSDSKKTPVEAVSPTDTGTVQHYSLAQQLGLGVRRIVLDPGHGGKDPGATANGLKEKDIVLAISKRTAHVLESIYGYEVSLTRSGDYFLPLEERTAIANTKKADLFLSVHINAHPDRSARGIETYYLNLATNAEAMRVAALENATSTHNISEMQDILASLMQNSKINESSRLAQAVHSKLIAGLQTDYNVRDLGVKQAPFYVLLGAQMPSILAEIAFITNQDEANLLEKREFQNEVAAKLAAGVVAYINQNATAAMIMD